jgi:eukaryotic-like serine/threonine-protein kinase
MSFIKSFMADRLIADVREARDPTSAQAQKALAKLKSMGPSVVPSVIEALTNADKRETLAFVEVLTALADTKSFPLFAKALAEGTPRTAAGVGWALSSSKAYSPNLLLELLGRADAPKPAVLEIIASQRSRFTLRDLLNSAYQQEPGEKAALFKIIADIADESSVDELIARVEGKDPVGRIHIIGVLARFNNTKVREALQATLKDPSKLVRTAALQALAKMEGPIDPSLLCRQLRDPEVEIQNLAVDVLCRARHPETVNHLVEVLKDESELVRRAAVEVLNEVGDERSIKHLLGAIKDSDWWVRSRAADALGKIGGPRVINAALALVTDRDEEIRRIAIEILNQTKDERALEHLIKATADPDWWVSERAVDAIGAMGPSAARLAVPRLLEMLQGNPKSLPSVARALGKIGDSRALEGLVRLLKRGETDVRVEALAAVAKLADDKRCDEIRNVLLSLATDPESTVAQAAVRAISEVETRFGMPSTFGTTGTFAGAAASGSTSGVRPGPAVEGPKTMLMDSTDMAAVIREVEAQPKLDIAMLKPGDVLENRYKFVQQIGKGAFGTVLLMEDTMVQERLILKFLNANVSQDQEMMQRFVHELRYSRKITHPNVIRIYDFLQIQGAFAISMEYFPSHTLGVEISDGKPMEVKRAVQFGIDIATGMAVAHKAGIVHRDLKPANVLINDESLLKIVDFGVAAAQREGDTQLTRTGYVIGSPKYMAPEQILGKKVDERADVYSLGVILYEMLTGTPPYHRGDHMSVMYQHVQGKARAPAELNAGLPQELSDLVVKAMSVDKTKRHQNMLEMRVALELFL